MEFILRHAFLVEGMGDSTILQNFIDVMDQPSVVFFIHWDKKFVLPILSAKHAEIKFIEQSKVSWGSTSLSKVTLRLLEEAFKEKFDYYHLISSQDFILCNWDCFDEFFSRNKGKQFIDISELNTIFSHRISTYHYLEQVDLPRKLKYKLSNFSGKLQQLVGIDRLKKFHLKRETPKGEHWFSIDNNFVGELLSSKSRRLIEQLLKYTFISDEMWVQLLYYNSHFFEYDFTKIRLIDWKRGNPYIFKESDFSLLKRDLNMQKLIFIRKVDVDLSGSLKKELQRL